MKMTESYIDRHGRHPAHDYAGSTRLYPCRYNHAECASWTWGPCVDEVLTDHEAEDPECPLCDHGPDGGAGPYDLSR